MDAQPFFGILHRTPARSHRHREPVQFILGCLDPVAPDIYINRGMFQALILHETSWYILCINTLMSMNRKGNDAASLLAIRRFFVFGAGYVVHR